MDKMTDDFQNRFEKLHNSLIADLQEPRFVGQGAVTTAVFANPVATVLEINSKSGLYPLFATYSLYRAKLTCSSAKKRKHSQKNS